MDRSSTVAGVKEAGSAGVRHWYEDPYAGRIGLFEQMEGVPTTMPEFGELDRYPEPGMEYYSLASIPDPHSLVLLPHELDGWENAPRAVVACGLLFPGEGRWEPPSLVRSCDRLLERLDHSSRERSSLLEEPVPSLEFLFLEEADLPGLTRTYHGWTVPLHRGRLPFAFPESAVQALARLRNHLRTIGRMESPLPWDRREAVRARSSILARGA